MLIDNNILLDFALNRPPNPLAARELIHRIETTSTAAFVAWHSIATFYYVVENNISRAAARAFVVQFAGFLTVAPVDHQSLLYAISLSMSDFEDAMQVAAAQAAGVEYIITRNIRDFANSPITAITPEQALRELF